MPTSPSMPGAVISAGILRFDVHGRPLANIGNPTYALGAFLLLTLVPYLVPLEYMELIKIASPGRHLLICLLLGGSLFAAYSLYAFLFQPRLDLRTDLIQTGTMETLHRFCTILIWTGIIANLGLLLWCIPHYRGTIFSMKAALADLEGVNILSQSYLFALGPYIYLSIMLGRSYRKTMVWLAVLLTLRALLLAERLAILEFAVPVLVVLSLLGQITVPLSRVFLIGAAVPTLFVVGEIFRSFYAKFVQESGWSHLDLGFILQWNLERLALYYADVTNKFYFLLQEQYFYMTDFYLQGVLRIGSRLGLTERPSSDDLWILIDQFDVSNEEMTNPGGLAVLLSDFGWWGWGVLALLVFLFFLLHWRAVRGHILALALYPVFFLTIVELPRFVYLYSSRSLTPLLLFLMAYAAALLLAGHGSWMPRPARREV